ncbi:MAG: serine/threonine protein kinase [Deltaproteobacteria bacterium]|nr:MAG: serine/threonine protein kinase [Deltaproteobacteria bacterium]
MAVPTAPGFEAAHSEADPLLGRTINDRYTIVEQIGHGGMGRVYKALQAPLDRVVALKVLGAGHDRDPNFYKRFFLEASVTAKLTHPNTITLYDYGRTQDGVFYIAMEYLAGRTLSQAMAQDGPLSQERVIHIAQQICRSLREAHALRIIHRDLKPANVILLQQHDDHDFVKVLDFGLVKFFHGENPEGDITNAGTFMGSPHYIAPEQARNQSPDQRCDIYSLGVLLYHMLAGRVPFTADAPVDIILKHLHEPPQPLREARPDLDIAADLDAVVLQCLAKARQDRYQSMDELLKQLKRVRTQISGISAPPSTPPHPMDTQPLQRPLGEVPQTPPTPQPGLSTPSEPMRAHVPVPPPPPPDAYEVTPPPRRPGRVLEKRALWIGGAAGVLVLAGISLSLRTKPAPAPLPAPPPPTLAATTPVALPPQEAPPAPQQAAEEETTLVTVTSTPSAAELLDADNRLLGTTPFDLRVPRSKPVVLTLRHDGFKPLTLKKTAEGDRMPLSVTLKEDSKADNPPNRRSVGYKDDPY